MSAASPAVSGTQTVSAPAKQSISDRIANSPYTIPVLASTILILGQTQYGFLESWDRTALAIVTSIVVELLLGLILNRKVPNVASAYVSGISCGILVRSPEYWPYAFAAAISILSKYVIRIDGRHLWNPSNLAIAALLFLAPNTVASLSVHWGNALWPMLVVWTLGSIVVWKLRRFHICATYVVSFVFYAWLRSVFTGNTFWSEVAPITGPMYQLFIFFMITDPKTTTRTPWGQMTVAFLVATVESALRFSGSFYPAMQQFAIHAPYYALFTMGPSANLIEIAIARFQKSRTTANTASTSAVSSTSTVPATR